MPLHDQKIDLNTGIVQEPDEGCVDVYEVEARRERIYMSVEEYGKVYLIGAGTGNPNYLTKKAERLIREADVILYDRLVNPLILQYANLTTEIIDVGKKPYAKHIQQEKINDCIVEAAHRDITRLLDLKVAIQRYLVVCKKKSTH